MRKATPRSEQEGFGGRGGRGGPGQRGRGRGRGNTWSQSFFRFCFLYGYAVLDSVNDTVTRRGDKVNGSRNLWLKCECSYRIPTSCVCLYLYNLYSAFIEPVTAYFRFHIEHGFKHWMHENEPAPYLLVLKPVDCYPKQKLYKSQFML